MNQKSEENNNDEANSELTKAKAKWCDSAGKWILNDNTSDAFDRSVLDK